MINSTHKVVARLVRVETEPDKDEFYLVFEVVDQAFKAKVKENWTADIELMVIEKEKEKEE
jgi:hypothetical protein